MRCDCKEQLDESLKKIQKHGSGVVFYLDQEGRGIGLENKIKAYALQDKGQDTLDANLSLGLPGDARDYSIISEILNSWKINTIELMTNNPLKIRALEEKGISVKRSSLWVNKNNLCQPYLKTKQEKMGHIS